MLINDNNMKASTLNTKMICQSRNGEYFIVFGGGMHSYKRSIYLGMYVGMCHAVDSAFDIIRVYQTHTHQEVIEFLENGIPTNTRNIIYSEPLDVDMNDTENKHDEK